MSRIVIEDLPEIQDLSETELQEIYGAGRPVRRKSRESFPGIVHLELLERREVFSATGLQGVVQAPTSENVAVEMQGSKVEKDSAGNTVFTQSENGSVIAKAVFSPTGQIMSYERTVGDVRVAADYQNGKVSVVKSWKGGIPANRQEFAADGSVTKETQYDSITGKKTVETTFNGSTRQVTVYVDGNTARVQTIKTNAAKKEVVIYEETWSGGKRISQSVRSENGELISQWQTNGDHRFEVVVENGIRAQRTFFKGVQILHEQYSNLKDLSATLANQLAQAKKAGQSIVNQKDAELGISKLSEKPIRRESWTEAGKCIKVEAWSYLTIIASLAVPSQKLATIVLSQKQTVITYDPNNNDKQIRENFVSGVLRERTITDNGILLEQKTWDNSGRKLTRTYYKDGYLERQELFDTNGLSARRFYQRANGGIRCVISEIYEGATITVNDSRLADRDIVNVLVSGKLNKSQTIMGNAIVEQTEFHANGKVKSHFIRHNAQAVATTLYNETGQRTEAQVFERGNLQSTQRYAIVADKEVPTVFTVFDAKGKRVHQTSYEYLSNGVVVKRARDFQASGEQEIQRREWMNGVRSAYYIWNWSGKVQTCIVKRIYEKGRLVQDVEKAPDGTLLKDHKWNWLPRLNSPTILDCWPGEQYGESVYRFDPPPGFNLGGYIGQLEDKTGAYFENVGEIYGANIADPLLNAAGTLDSKYKALRKKLAPYVDAAGKVLADTLRTGITALGNANSVWKTVQKMVPTSSGITQIGKDVNEKWQGVRASTENNFNTSVQVAGDTLKNAVDRSANAMLMATKTIDTVKTSVTANYSQLISKADNVVSTGKTAWENTKNAAEPIIQIIKGVLAEDLFKVEADSVGKLSLNFATGCYYADFELLKGLKVDSEGFKALMTGDFKLPEIDPLKAAVSLTGLKSSVTTNYDDVREAEYEEHGGANVYFASKRFAEWAGPGTVARAVAAALAGDGGQILAEAKNHLSLELEDLSIWLQQRGAKDAPKLAVQILRAIVDQSSLDLPEILSVEFRSVNFTNHLSAGGAVGAATDAIGIDASASATLSHMAFAIVWKGGSASDPLLDSISKFQSMKLQGGMDDFNALALEELDKLNLPGSDFLKEILLTGHVGVDSDNALDKTVMNKFSEMFGIDASASLAEYLHTEYLKNEGNPIIDLSQYGNLKDTLNSRLSELAIGNEGSAELTTLQFNLNTMSFEVEFVVHHKYASGSLADIGKDLVGMAS